MTARRYASWNVSRRRLIQGAGAGALGVMGAALIGCSQDDEDEPTSTPSIVASASASSSPTTAGGPKRGGELVVRKHVNLDRGDPQRGSSGTNSILTRLYAEPLLVSGVDGSVSAYLAESFEFNDGAEAIFKLRPDIPFGDGTMMTAEDVVYTFERGKADDTITRATHGQIASIETPDDYTVKVTLKAPNAAFIEALGGPAGVVIPKAAAESMGVEQYNVTPIGAGPYILDKNVMDSEVTYVKNPKWPFMGEDGSPLPYLDRVKIKIIPDVAVALAALQNGETHLDDSLAAVDVPGLHESLGLIRLDGARVGATQFVTQKPPTDDVRLRQALNFAIDKEESLTVLAAGIGQVGKSALTELSWAYDANAPFYSFNPDEAAKMLSAGGFDGMELRVASYAAPVSDLLQAQLARLGLNVVVEMFDVPTYQEKFLGDGAFPVGTSAIGAAAVGDPDIFLRDRYGSGGRQNPGKPENPHFDELIDKAASVFSREERIPIYSQIMQLDYDEAYRIWTWNEPRVIGHSKSVQGVVVTASLTQLAAAWLDA